MISREEVDPIALRRFMAATMNVCTCNGEAHDECREEEEEADDA